MFLRSILGNAGAQIPTDDTKTYSTLSTFDETRYYLNSLLHQSPKVRDVIIHTFGDGVHHVGDAGKKISYRVSTDRGLTFGAKATLYDPTDGVYQIQDPSAGFDNSGRLHIMADCHTSVGVAGGTNELRYMYSDDNLATVSSPVVITLPANGLNGFRMYGRIIDLGNGVLLAPAYFFTDEGDSTQSSRYVLRTTDGGANWAWVLVEGPTSDYRNESELLAVTNDIVFMVSRYETAFQYWMYKSVDKGVTWTNIGILGTTITLDSPHGPCRLHKFKADNGVWMSVMYFPHKSQGRLYAIYGRLDNGVLGDLALFNTSTITLLRDDTAQLHYFDLCHYNRNMNARGASPREQGSFPTDNEMIYFENMATHYDAVSAHVLPVTIYDRIGVPELIMTWRGMVTNTDNGFGTVNGSSQVTTWKSIAPGPLARNFTATAGGVMLGTGIEYDGTKALTAAAAATWGFLSFSSLGVSDVNWVFYANLKLGTGSDPNAAYGIFGTSAATSGNRGVSIFYDDRVSVPRNNALVISHSRTGGVLLVNFANADIITPNVFFNLCIVYNLAEATANDRVKVWINNVFQTTTLTYTSLSISNPPTNPAQIGATGNNVLIATAAFKDIVLQNSIGSEANRSNMVQSLMEAEGIT